MYYINQPFNVYIYTYTRVRPRVWFHSGVNRQRDYLGDIHLYIYLLYYIRYYTEPSYPIYVVLLQVCLDTCHNPVLCVCISPCGETDSATTTTISEIIHTYIIFYTTHINQSSVYIMSDDACALLFLVVVQQTVRRPRPFRRLSGTRAGLSWPLSPSVRPRYSLLYIYYIYVYLCIYYAPMYK
jgi:hypothetical protein